MTKKVSGPHGVKIVGRHIALQVVTLIFLMASLTRLKKGKEKSDSQIKKIQTEIDDLKQVIEDTETQKTNLKRQLRQQRLGKGPKRSNFFKNLQHAKMKRIYLS